MAWFRIGELCEYNCEFPSSVLVRASGLYLMNKSSEFIYLLNLFPCLSLIFHLHYLILSPLFPSVLCLKTPLILFKFNLYPQL
jgi:hypothetical protein